MRRGGLKNRLAVASCATAFDLPANRYCKSFAYRYGRAMDRVRIASGAATIAVHGAVLGLLFVAARPAFVAPAAQGEALHIFDIALDTSAPEPARAEPAPPVPQPAEQRALPTSHGPPPEMPVVARPVVPIATAHATAPAIAALGVRPQPVNLDLVGAHLAPAVPRASATAATTTETTARPSDYALRLVRWLERHKRYPPELAREMRDATVVLRFRIDPRGRIEQASVADGSGMAWLDALALDQLRDAAPLPRPPTGLTAAERVFEVPLRYRAR